MCLVRYGAQADAHAIGMHHVRLVLGPHFYSILEYESPPTLCGAAPQIRGIGCTLAEMCVLLRYRIIGLLISSPIDHP